MERGGRNTRDLLKWLQASGGGQTRGSKRERKAGEGSLAVASTLSLMVTGDWANCTGGYPFLPQHRVHVPLLMQGHLFR